MHTLDGCEIVAWFAQNEPHNTGSYVVLKCPDGASIAVAAREWWTVVEANKPWIDRHTTKIIDGRARSCVIRKYTGTTQAEMDQFLDSRFSDKPGETSEKSGWIVNGESWRFVLI